MKILLLEDEYPAAERLQRLLRQADPAAEVLAVLRSVADARQWLTKAPLISSGALGVPNSAAAGAR